MSNHVSHSEKKKEDWVPYTYFLFHIPTKLKYYGVRYARNCHPDEFWNSYKTSSKYVKELIDRYGDKSFLFEIRKTFVDTKSARIWEHKVLRRLKVTKREDYINKTDNISISPQMGKNNPSTIQENKNKISQSILKWYETNSNPRLGTKTPNEVKLKQSIAKQNTNNPFYGKQHTLENRTKFSLNQQGSNNSFFGKTHTESARTAISLAQKGKSKLTITCPHCNKIGAVNTMYRWHFDNCKKII